MSANLTTLIDQLRSHAAAERCAAAEELAHMGVGAQPAALALVAGLRTAELQTREWCVAALEELGPPSSDHIGELAKLAGHQSLDVAYWAITLLGRAGNDAAPAVLALSKALQSASESAVRERAAWALGKIGPAAKSAVPVLQEAVDSDSARLSRLAHQALAKIEL